MATKAVGSVVSWLALAAGGCAVEAGALPHEESAVTTGSAMDEDEAAIVVGSATGEDGAAVTTRPATGGDADGDSTEAVAPRPVFRGPLEPSLERLAGAPAEGPPEAVDEPSPVPTAAADAGAVVRVAGAEGAAAYAAAWLERVDERIAVRASLLGADGAPQGAPITVAMGASAAAPPDVAWSGDAFAVVWVDATDVVARVKLVTLSLDGRVGPVAVPVSQGTAGVAAPRVAPHPEGGFTVAWSDSRWHGAGGGTEIVARRVGRDLRTVGAERRLSHRPGPSRDVAVARAGYGVAVAWTDGEPGPLGQTVQISLATSRFDVRVTARASHVEARASSPAIAGSADGFGYAWVERTADSWAVVAESREADGALRCGRQILGLNVDREAPEPSIAADGDGWRVAWTEDAGDARVVVLASLGTSCQLENTTAPLTPRRLGWAALTRSADGLALAWTEPAGLLVSPL